MPVPRGDASSEEVVLETQAAMRLFEDLKSMGIRILNIAEKPPGARTPSDRDQLVNYLVLYRRVKALPR